MPSHMQAAVVEDTVRQMWSVRFKEASSETDGRSMTDRALVRAEGKRIRGRAMPVRTPYTERA